MNELTDPAAGTVPFWPVIPYTLILYACSTDTSAVAATNRSPAAVLIEASVTSRLLPDITILQNDGTNELLGAANGQSISSAVTVMAPAPSTMIFFSEDVIRPFFAGSTLNWIFRLASMLFNPRHLIHSICGETL